MAYFKTCFLKWYIRFPICLCGSVEKWNNLWRI